MSSMADKAAASSKREYFDALHALAEDSSDDEDDSLDRPCLSPSFAQLTAIRDVNPAPPAYEVPAAEPAPMPTLSIEVKAIPVVVRNSIVQLPLPAPNTNGEVQEVVNGAPLQTFQAKLRQGKAATPLSNEISFVSETPHAAGPVPAGLPAPAQQVRSKSPVRTASVPLPRLPSLLRASSLNFSLSSTATANKRKRKEAPLKMAPEERQVFKGLSFFYIPPDDINPTRKLRITKAREHGATWVKEWNGGESISHVIVDSNLSNGDILKWLKLEKMPSELILVNEQWPMDSIKYRFLVNPKQMMYEVKGHDEASRRDAEVLGVQEPDTSQESVRSLRIKKKLANPGRRDHVPPKQTPERSDGSSGPRNLPGAVASRQSAFSESPDLEEILKLAAVRKAKAEQPNPTPMTGGRRELNSVLQAAKALAGPASESSRPTDALEEAMTEARWLDDLPLDSSDDERSSHGSSRLSNSSKSLPNRQHGDDSTAYKKQKFD